MVAATLDIYNTIADNLLPTPAKSHYTFNLRDLSKVFQVRAWTLASHRHGPSEKRHFCCHAPGHLHPHLIGTPVCGPFHSSAGQGVLQGSANLISEKEQFVRLWSHECLRIFHDRLVDDSDRVWFNHMLEEKVTYVVDVSLCGIY